MARTHQAQLSFADLEFRQLGIALDPLLQTIAHFLDQHQQIIEKVGTDLLRGLKNPRRGRQGLTPSQVLRSLVLMRIKNWDLRELSDRIADGYTLRWFTDFRSSQPVPKHDAFSRAFNRLIPETMKAINDFVVHTAVDLGLEDGCQLRVDTTVVQTDIHHPTDNTLLWDVVRVITRLVRRLFKKLGRRVRRFSNHTRAARRRSRQIQRMPPTQRHTQQRKRYRELIALAEEVVQAARAVLQRTRHAHSPDPLLDIAIRAIRQQIEHFCQLGERVINQTRRRVLQGEQVPASEKVYSIFEAHTDLIKRGKIETPLEFGHKVFLAESAKGLITQYEVLDGNPPDELHVRPSLKNHRKTFGHAPHLYSTDRGFHSPQNVKECQQAGVEQECIPQCGGQKTPERETYEKSRDFKKGQRFRAGIEGRISVLMRGRGMKRCRAEGRSHFKLFVGAAVLANNLLRIAALIRKSVSHKKRAASKVHSHRPV
jgi:transposase, IS5 family